MNRRDFLLTTAFAATHGHNLLGAAPAALFGFGDAPAQQPILEEHFPSRLYQFVWRNWELANADRMAEVIHATAKNIQDLGAEMGLPSKPLLSDDQLRRIYITVIRQNWHLLPEMQIISLLGWTPQHFAFTLKEDDFLDIKLGSGKPVCEELTYRAPSAAERTRAAAIQKSVQSHFGKSILMPGEKRFQFVEELSSFQQPSRRDESAHAALGEVNLSAGWRVIAHGDGISSAAQRFCDYLKSSMHCVLSEAPGDTHVIKLVIDHGIDPGATGFSVDVQASHIQVASHSAAGVMRGIYWLREQMERRGGPYLTIGRTTRRTEWNPRFAYSYFALYGDPLMETDPFPDAYLERMASTGINGVWIQGVLNTLAPSKLFPEFGEGSEIRLKNLNALVTRAARFGVKVYLYLNEPRAMPLSFFDHRPQLKGSHHEGLYAICTSVPEVREWISDTLTHVFEKVPELGGIFSITMSENHTNCFSHGGTWGDGLPNAGDCPRCSKRNSWDVIAELIRTFRDGVRKSSSSADVISWDWGWGMELARRTIPLLPKDVGCLSVSEWDAPVHRGGVDTKVGEYSISVTGPGPRAKQVWAWAREAGLKTMAKTQFNNTWEISAVPYIPVLDLILEQCEKLSQEKVEGVLASWTCGGYASPNMHAAMQYGFEPHANREDVLLAEAARSYGHSAAPAIADTWRQFSTAFREFPYGVAIYTIPTQHGSANPLRVKPTGYTATAMLFPYDDYTRWCGKYPPEVAQSQFSRMADLWTQGMRAFETALKSVPTFRQEAIRLDLAIIRTCAYHFQSVANQLEFYILRDRLQAGGSGAAAVRSRMKQLALAEIELARQQYPVARAHSEIAYEASNHYYYTPLDLVEKVLNCEDVIATLGV